MQLSLIQRSRPAGAVIVSTPQDLSLIDARRAVDLFNKTSVPVLGNHREYGDLRLPALRRGIAPVRQRRRGGSGAPRWACRSSAGLPLSLAIREASDAGNPPAASDGPEAEAFAAIAAKLLAAVAH